MASERLGLGEVLRLALWSPWGLFEAYQAGRVETRPFWIYVVGSCATGASLGPWLASETGQSWVGLSVGLGLVLLLLSPLYWLLDVAVVHGTARLLGGRGAWHDTRASIGLSSAAQVLAFVPWLGTLLIIWSYVARVIGLRTLHQLKRWRAVVVVLMPSALSLCLGVGLRAFWLEAFKMPSGSMAPSLLVGDHLFVKKSAYGFGTALPGRGDVVVFVYPEPNPHVPRVDYVKRVIGLPGDELTFQSGAPSVNGWPVPRCELGRASLPMAGENEVDMDLFVEFLGGHSYLVGLERERDEGVQGPYTVAPGEFWVIGDNRNNSSDSRSWNRGQGGGVPRANLKGQVAWLWFPPERFGLSLLDAPQLPASLGALAPQLERCLKAAPDLAHQTPPAPQ